MDHNYWDKFGELIYLEFFASTNNLDMLSRWDGFSELDAFNGIAWLNGKYIYFY